MKINAIRHFHLTLLGLGVLVSCDRLPEQIKPETRPSEVEEEMKLSMETLVNRMIETQSRNVEEAQKEGHTKTVGHADGKWWSEVNNFTRSGYIRGVVDLAVALDGTSRAVLDRALEQQAAKKNVEPIFRKGGVKETSIEAGDFLANRIMAVMAGHSFLDVIEAVTKFYQNKPLQKNKPVIWVLAVPLYNELQESLPKEKRNSSFDTVSVPMKRTIQK